MKTIIEKGTNKDTLIEEFAKKYNLKKEEVNYDVISEGTKGFLGLGAKPAIIKFKFDELESRIRNFIQNFFKVQNNKIGTIDITSNEEFIFINVNEVENTGFYIGRHGSFLESFEHILNRMLKNKIPACEKYAILDIEEYRKRQKEKLLTEIKSICTKVLDRNKSIRLRPMSSRERRTVHKYIETRPNLQTMTVGKRNYKRIVIFPTNQENENSKNRTNNSKYKKYNKNDKKKYSKNNKKSKPGKKHNNKKKSKPEKQKKHSKPVKPVKNNQSNKQEVKPKPQPKPQPKSKPQPKPQPKAKPKVEEKTNKIKNSKGSEKKTDFKEKKKKMKAKLKSKSRRK